jgi:hypothetical protein
MEHMISITNSVVKRRHLHLHRKFVHGAAQAVEKPRRTKWEALRTCNVLDGNLLCIAGTSWDEK